MRSSGSVHARAMLVLRFLEKLNEIGRVRKTQRNWHKLVQAGISSNSRCSPLFMIVRAEILSVGRCRRAPARRHDCFRPREGIEITGNWTDGGGKIDF